MYIPIPCPGFVKFTGQFVVQLGEASSVDQLKIKSFPLPLSGVAFSWFSALLSNSIITWIPTRVEIL